MTRPFPSLLVRVIKIGGSLFQYRELPDLFRAWLAQQPPKTSLVVVGGGVLAEGVRQLDRRFRLEPALADQLAIETMAIESRILQALIPNMEWIENITAFIDPPNAGCARKAAGCRPETIGCTQQSSGKNMHVRRAHPTEQDSKTSSPAIGIVNPVAFMIQSRANRFGVDLPQSWAVTSDSIAAQVAHAADADELVLLKSCLPGTESAVPADHAVAVGYVDSFFPRAAAGLQRIRAVDLHASGFPEVHLRA